MNDEKQKAISLSSSLRNGKPKPFFNNLLVG
jgi:hypothetical protein